MKTSFFLAGALALALVPGAALLPGCGGGGSSSASVPQLSFTQQLGVDFPDFPQYRGILSVDLEDTASSSARAAGTLRVYSDATRPTPTAVVGATPTPSASDFAVSLAPGTYILVGDVNGTAGTGYALDLRGSYAGGPDFTLRGPFQEGATIAIAATFKSGNSVLVGRLTPVGVTPTPVPTRVSATPVATPVITATPATTATPSLSPTPIGGATPVPTATAVSPTPVGAGGGTTDPPQVP